MLLKLKNEAGQDFCINPDYIINLYTIVNDKTTKINVVGRMIDGSFIPLTEHDTQEQADDEFKRIIRETNKKRD